MRKRSFVDLAILGFVFWGVWSLRFAGVENIGFWSVLAAVGVGAALVTVRNESWRDFGWRTGGNARFVLSRAGESAFLALVTGYTVIVLATAIGYPPSQSTVLAQAVWFGAGHISQGISGMIMAGGIGVVLGSYFLTRGNRALIPLMIGHGIIDTVSQTIFYLS